MDSLITVAPHKIERTFIYIYRGEARLSFGLVKTPGICWPQKQYQIQTQDQKVQALARVPE
jgi:hypothetical protein